VRNRDFPSHLRNSAISIESEDHVKNVESMLAISPRKFPTASRMPVVTRLMICVELLRRASRRRVDREQRAGWKWNGGIGSCGSRGMSDDNGPAMRTSNFSVRRTAVGKLRNYFHARYATTLIARRCRCTMHPRRYTLRPMPGCIGAILSFAQHRRVVATIFFLPSCEPMKYSFDT
jgi:hypothetical protein